MAVTHSYGRASISQNPGSASQQNRPLDFRLGSTTGHSAMSAQCPVCPKADIAGRFTRLGFQGERATFTLCWPATLSILSADGLLGFLDLRLFALLALALASLKLLNLAAAVFEDAAVAPFDLLMPVAPRTVDPAIICPRATTADIREKEVRKRLCLISGHRSSRTDTPIQHYRY
jgi:hypothetical protein